MNNWLIWALTSPAWFDWPYPQANQATKEAIGINALMDSLPGPAVETRLHVIRGQPTNLQQAMAYAMEVDSVLESTRTKGPAQRSHVNQIDGDKVESSSLKELKEMAAALQKL